MTSCAVANSARVRPARPLCRPSQVVLNPPQLDRALGISGGTNQFSFEHSSRNVTLKLSTNAFSTKVPREANWSWIRHSYGTCVPGLRLAPF